MSELQTRFIDDTYVEYYNTGKHDLAQIYLKSEADKVIAEKDKEIAELKAQYNSAILWKYDAQNEHNTVVASCMENIKLKAKLAKQDKELRRQKYKRCMNNAWWCLREEFFAEDCHCEHWVDWAIKWYKRWLAIAEKFKQNSTAK